MAAHFCDSSAVWLLPLVVRQCKSEFERPFENLFRTLQEAAVVANNFIWLVSSDPRVAGFV